MTFVAYRLEYENGGGPSELCADPHKLLNVVEQSKLLPIQATEQTADTSTDKQHRNELKGIQFSRCMHWSTYPDR